MCGRTLIPDTLRPVSERVGPRRGDDAHVRVWATFLKTHAAVVRQLEHELAEERGLPLSWYDVLLELNAAPGRRLRMQELGERVVLSRTRVSRIVDEMVRHRLVAREPDPADRRATFAALTSAGRKALRAAAPVYLRGIREHFTSHLSEPELTIIGESLGRVLEAQRPHTAHRNVEAPSPPTDIPRTADGAGVR